MYFELSPRYTDTMNAMALGEGLEKIARSMARDAAIGRRIAEKARQHILNQRARDAHARYQQQQARRR